MFEFLGYALLAAGVVAFIGNVLSELEPHKAQPSLWERIFGNAQDPGDGR